MSQHWLALLVWDCCFPGQDLRCETDLAVSTTRVGRALHFTWWTAGEVQG